MEFDWLVEDADAMANASIVHRYASDPRRLDVLWSSYLVSGLRIVSIINRLRNLSVNTGLPKPLSEAP